MIIRARMLKPITDNYFLTINGDHCGREVEGGTPNRAGAFLKEQFIQKERN